MGLRRSAARAGSFALVSLLATASAHAVAPRPARRVVADELTAMPAAGLTRQLRSQREVRYASQATPAWSRFAVRAGGTWGVAWDSATSVPNRIWGSGIAIPGANASPAIAERAVRQLIADHLDLLSPGAQASDFILVSNHSDGDIRSVGFLQLSGGRRVVGGQLSFRFKRDRLFVIGSEALPHVKVVAPRARLATAQLRTRARDNLRRELELPVAEVTEPGDEVILPLVGDDAVLGYRVARALTIDGGAEGRYLAYVDPASGNVLAVHQQNRYATGQLQYRSVDRHPGRGRVDRPARSARVAVNGVAQTTTPTGGLTWSPDVAATVTTSVVGDLVTVVNKAVDGGLAAVDLALAPGGVALWDTTTDEKQDAQVQVFIATNRVKDYVRANIDPGMVGLEASLVANVNIAQNCNAFFDGKSINFFHANAQCQNTGLLEDVVFHEYGHAVHAAEIIEGVGSFDGAMSEGAADFLAASITNDPGMGRGFFHTDEALRDIDPVASEYTWPKDIQEIHHTGLIYGGTFWDLRKALLAARPEAEALALVNKLFVATLRRSVSIPSSMVEALAADDDDGDLSNGTPNECFIRDAYGRHGLRTATGTVTAPGPLTANAKSTVVRVDLAGLSPRCGGDGIDSVTLTWRPGHTATPPPGETVMTAVDTTRFWASLPLATDDVTYYSAKVKFLDGSILTLADNLADPYYTLYQGTTVPLYCTSFDSDPFAEGWTTGTSDGSPSPWAWGIPAGGGTDPPAPYSGSHILAQNLAGDYLPKVATHVQLPPIDVGAWSDVHLQYRRWLAVEDSHFDQARVVVNGQRAWVNFNSNMGDSSSIHHIDREWRFHDVSVSGYAFGHTLNVAFDLTTDEGLQLGGWQIDDLCVVANVNSVCGDGVKSATEQCDDGPGNENVPGACRTYCRLPTCGDHIVDASEVCDDGIAGSDTCTAACAEAEIQTLGGCCSSSRGAGGALALGALVG
ncbi:MAG: hypothetical protein M3680_22180, partial [Myxococcota bacterium]|nr:hypothetical protein [Myxococcota bacterium]